MYIVHTSKCRRSFINGDLTGHVRDGHLVGLYLHSLSSCSSILGSWNGQPETLNLHLVLWPLNKTLVSIDQMVSRILFSPIPNYFSPNLLLILTSSKWIFVWGSKYTEKMPWYPLIFIKRTKRFMKKQLNANLQSMQELWKQDLHLVLWPLNKKLVSINLLISPIPNYFSPNLLLVLTSSSWIFLKIIVYKKEWQSILLFLSKEPNNNK